MSTKTLCTIMKQIDIASSNCQCKLTDSLKGLHHEMMKNEGIKCMIIGGNVENYLINL